MAYYPILNVLGYSGWTKLFNFAPNNWEGAATRRRDIYLSWSDGLSWNHCFLDYIEPNGFKRIASRDINHLLPPGQYTAFLSLRDDKLPEKTLVLPSSGGEPTTYPFWRSTIGLESPVGGETSYQGEIVPFSAQGSFMTFGYCLQFGEGIENFLLFTNLESAATFREGEVEIRRAKSPGDLLGTARVTANSVGVIPLDPFGFTNEDLPLFICRQLSGIPLFLSSAGAGHFLSLEHTHPPASMVVHGKRWLAQSQLKQNWYARSLR